MNIKSFTVDSHSVVYVSSRFCLNAKFLLTYNGMHATSSKDCSQTAITYQHSRNRSTTILHPLNGLFSRRTWVSQYQKGKTSVNLSEARDDGDGSGISKQSTPRFRQTTTLASLNFFARWMLFLMSNQQCQRTEGTHTHTHI